ncbi:CSEP0046 putative effector protein [Blumeria hordei DH14]|uniref:CSEP0046 putative effector protein n=1 Tax=Blumeria graminis f. sp. hordei (strain DH14) TaxID=546991 RepID=N1J9U1_BLUG1|nr:CSEP0046 putative effector protein [Blumeria hordei DH14]
MAALVAGIAGILKIVDAGQSIIGSITAKEKFVDFYSIRIEIGNNQDASGNPPSIILTDFANTEIFGVFEGSSKKPDDMCRNNRALPIGDLDSPDLSLFKGLRNGEAPIQSFKTNNGFNLKSVDIQPGGNAICVSNIILKGSDTQARRDEIFLPIGDIGFLCGDEWNLGTILDGNQQRCMWLDGQPDNGNNPIQSLNLDMEKIAVLFNTGKRKTLENASIDSLCAIYSDNVGKITNRNDCKESFKREITGKNITIDTLPLLDEASTDFTGGTFSVANYIGAGFVTTDQKIFDSVSGKFEDVTIESGGSTVKARHSDKHKSKPTISSRAFAKMGRRLDSKPEVVNHSGFAGFKRAEVMKVQTCQATENGIEPTCTLVETISVPPPA